MPAVAVPQRTTTAHAYCVHATTVRVSLRTQCSPLRTVSSAVMTLLHYVSMHLKSTHPAANRPVSAPTCASCSC